MNREDGTTCCVLEITAQIVNLREKIKCIVLALRDRLGCVLSSCSCSVLRFVNAQDEFIGRQFMPRVGATFHAGDKEVPRSKVSLPIVVKKVKGVWLLSGRAWIKKTDVVPLKPPSSITLII